jgi:small-conductance mechanosensitive channel
MLGLLLAPAPAPALAQAPAGPPGLGGSAPAGTSGAASPRAEETAAPTADNPQATLAEAPGKIDVDQKIDPRRVRQTLEKILPRYPGVYDISVQVDGNVVTLDGHVEDAEVRDKMRDVALKVEGVVFVINKIRTDAQVLSAASLVMKRLRQYGGMIAQNWLLFVMALAMFALGMALARVFAMYGDVLLLPFSPNPLLRSVLVSLLSAGIVLAGTFSALQVFGIAQAVLSVLGVAGVAALALGFAFRDIAENFIASVLLGVRRPFRVGDYVQIADKAGVVKALNTRATILVTLEGHHVRIPNSIVFKEVMVNMTAAPATRQVFDVLVPYDASTAKATDVITGALRSFEGLAVDPAPRALVDGLTPEGVRLRAYYWVPSKGVDGFKINSDALLRAKVALQQAGIAPPPTRVSVSAAGPIALDLARHGDRAPDDGHAPGRPATASEARANLAHDARTARATSADSPAAQDDALKQVMDAAGGGDVANEGQNLLPEPPSSGEHAAAGAPAENGNGRAS